MLPVPRSCVYDLWDAFNDIAEGFGLSIEEFQEILKSALLEHLGVTERVLNIDTDKVFRVFDNDENNLVDSLEFLSSFALLSGMTPDEKIRFVFAMYDFDESSVLTLDEMVLAFRSTLSGLAKLSQIDPPTELEVENIVVQAFETIRKAKSDSGIEGTLGSEGIEKEPFLAFCLNTPEIISWIEFFDDLEEYQRDLEDMKPIPLPAASHLDRSPLEEFQMNPTLGGFGKLSIEKKGLSKDLLPRLPWENVIPFVSPARLPDQIRESPVHNFELEWVYGWNCHCSRQSLYYSAKGALIYAAGAICIVQNMQTGVQSHFKLHTDMVTSLKVYHEEKGDTIVASGECGVHPSIFIWDCESKTTLSVLKGFHKIGIAQLDFSPNRKLLCSLGMDTYNSIAVYSWLSRERIWASRTTADRVYDLRFLEDNLIGSCGVNHVYFWRKDLTNVFKRYRGLFGTAVKEETLLTIASVGNTIVTGSETGMLHVWEGRNWISSIRGHSGRVNAMFVVDQGEEKGLITACTSGKVQVWNSKLEIGATFNANSLGAIEPTICAITWDLLTSKILIGFKSCEIFEMDSTDGRNIHKGSVVAGHFSPKLSGIATHPLNPNMICTVGKDKTVRIFDCSQHCQIKMAMLDTMAHCCTYSPDGQVILIGYGCGIEGREERKEGGFVALNEEDLTIIHEARDSKGMISDCKFTPDGRNFVLSSLDGSLYIYQASNYAAKAKCRGHGGKVIHFDISNDNQFIMSNSSVGELLFWDVERGEQQAPKLMREVQWETLNCVYSYSTQGIWSVHDDKTYCTAVTRSSARDVLCVSDNFGRIRVFNCPCVREDPNHLLLRGHSSLVENCKFSTNDGLFFTTGGTDGSVMQWKVTVPTIQDIRDMKKDEDNPIGDLLLELRLEGKGLEKSDHQRSIDQDNPMAICLMEEGVESAAAMQPWQRTIVAPSVVPPEDNSEPSDSLILEHVTGFAVDRSRDSLMYSPEGEIAFFVANVAVLMNQKNKKQKFYMEHSSTIMAMSVNPQESIIATGEQSETGTIRVWNTITLRTLSVLDGFHRRGVSHLSFSPDGRLLATCGQDKFHSVALYDWKNAQVISCAPSFTVKSFALKFHPSGQSIIQCGDEIIRFWEHDGLYLRHQDAMFSTRAKLQKFLCAGWIGGNAVVGAADGNIYRFIGRQLDGMVQAHVGHVNSIASSNDGVCSVGADGFCKVWSRILECRIMIDLKEFRALNINARCISWDADMGRALIGTLNSEIFEISTSDGENLHGGNLMEGHSAEELHGLATHPIKDQFATVGDDAILHVWDVFQYTAVSSVPLEMPARCCAYSPDGRRIAVGFGTPLQNNAKAYDGKWVVLDTEDYQVTHEARDSTKWLTDMKFSPSGDFFVVGSTDNKIYVYSVLNGFALNAAISQHNAVILSVDFSSDSAWLQSNCAGMELYYFETDTGMFIPAASRLRDQVWATQSCSMGWGVQGIWPAQKDATEITAVDCNLFRGVDGTVIASGDNYGRIQLHRYPSTSSFGCAKKYRPSSSPVTRIKFIAGDSYLVTLSGKDKAIFQWSHVRDRGADVAWNVVERGGAIDEDDEDILGFFCLSGKDDIVDLSEFKSIIGTRPWVAAMIAPTIIPKIVSDKPKFRLEKDHIFGVQGQLTRLSVRFNANGDVLYPISRYISVYNKKKNSQIYYEGHTTELSCVGVSPDGKFAGSADRSNRPTIHIWDANTCEIIVELQLLHRRGVVSIQFSKDNRSMVSVGQEQDHVIAVWESPSAEWHDGRLLAWNKGDIHPVLFCNFYNNEEFMLASGGRFHMKFWSLNGRSLNSTYAEYSSKQKLGTLLSGAAIDELTFVSGSTTGNLFVWKGRKLEKVIRAHEMGVSGLWASNIGVVSVSKDGMVKLWSEIMEHVRSFSLTDADVPPLMNCIRSVDAGFSDDGRQVTRILVSTMSSEIYEISAKSGTTCLMQESHFAGEIWGLGMHPIDPDIFATAGDDKTVRVWSISHKRIIRKAILDSTARCINFSPDGRLIIVGLGGSWDGKRQRKDGAFVILDAKTLKPQFEGRDSRHWLTEAKFSPDGKLFAVGSMDHKIYIYNRNSYRLKGMCDRHNSFIKNFDFSEDSVYIQSDSGDYEHLYFEAEDGQYFASGSQLKDIKWSDWTCTFGWPVQGCWPYFDDVNSGKESEPASIHRSPDKTLVSVGDLNGNVKLFNCPCTEKDAMRVEHFAHVKEVAQIRFSCDGKYIISVGKKDRSIITWKVKGER